MLSSSNYNTVTLNLPRQLRICCLFPDVETCCVDKQPTKILRMKSNILFSGFHRQIYIARSCRVTRKVGGMAASILDEIGLFLKSSYPNIPSMNISCQTSFSWEFFGQSSMYSARTRRGVIVLPKMT